MTMTAFAALFSLALAYSAAQIVRTVNMINIPKEDKAEAQHKVRQCLD
jgi:hypothetical protein